MGMYRVLSYSTKSMTLASTDTGSLKNFQNGTECRKARQILVAWESIFSLVRLWPSCTWEPQEFQTLHGDVSSFVMSNQEYDPRIYRHRFPKKFSEKNRAPKGSSNFGSVRVYLFVGMLVTIMYMRTPRVPNTTWGCIESCRIQPRVWPSHLPTPVPSKILKMESSAERLVKFW